MRLTKSKFLAGTQCPKRLYLQVHQPELAAQPDASSEAIIRQGREVGMLARQLFPGGVGVCERSLDQAIRATRELVANPSAPAVFEATFENAGVLVRVDVLQRRTHGRGWKLIEVKSSTDFREDHARLLRSGRLAGRPADTAMSLALSHAHLFCGDDQSSCVSLSSSSARPSAGRYRPKFNSKSLGTP